MIQVELNLAKWINPKTIRLNIDYIRREDSQEWVSI